MIENETIPNDSLSFEELCKLLLDESQIRFAGILDGMGNLVAGGFREGVEPLKNESERKKMFMEAVLRVRTRQDFDPDLGPVKYAASRRDAVVMMTFPIKGNNVLFVSAEPSIEIENFANKILNTIRRVLGIL
ncbi:MAG: DUF6659 family protein [Nitrosopumilus sp.]